MVSAESPVLNISSARIGVNVSPEEVQNLPVNGRNFASLMTLATGATSDGNGGWSSVRFNGKSNQQNTSTTMASMERTCGTPAPAT